MTEAEIQEMLSELSVLYGERDMLELDREALIDQVMTPEIKAKIAEINAEFADKQVAADERVAKLTNAIKAAVAEFGDTVSSQHLMAVYAKGRVSWDTAKLDGLAMVIPQLASARKEGQPSVTIRARGGK